uniref:IML10 n=1 Tax=Mythimna separata TaxID=271217 RepID=A0A8F3C7D2_MYTSE|nr:IML10 [Mythimna separata]
MFSKTFLVFLFLNFASDSYGQRAKNYFRKDYNYIEEVKASYKIHATPRSWTDAKQVCALESATLFYPENQKEARVVTSFWKETKPELKEMWIGLSDLLVEGVFETVDGKPISDVYVNWRFTEPNNRDDNEDCVALKDEDGQMNDLNCRIHAHFICKKSLNTLDWNFDCDMPNLDYTLGHGIGKCYKLHTTPLTWNEAYAICQLEQSTLAVINNKRERDYLVKLTASIPRPRVKEQYQRGIYHLGFYNKLKQGWKTVEGIALNVDNDAWFDNYQPDELTDHDECGSMFYTGRLINTDCGMKSFFICEHQLDHIIPASITLSDHPYVGGGTEI